MKLIWKTRRGGAGGSGWKDADGDLDEDDPNTRESRLKKGKQSRMRYKHQVLNQVDYSSVGRHYQLPFQESISQRA